MTSSPWQIANTARATGLGRLWQRLAIATNWPVLVAVAVLTTMGVISIWAASPADGPKQLVFAAIAFACLCATQAINYNKIGRFAWGFYALSLGLVVYTVAGTVLPLPGVKPIKGASCWIAFPGFSFEPSELMKLSFVMVLARYLRFRNNYRRLGGMLVPFLLCFVPMALILKQPDLGVASIFLPALLALLFVAGAKLRHMATIVAVGTALLPVFWLAGQPGVPVLRHLPSLVHKYQRGRVEGIFSPDDPKTLQGSGFQQYKALMAMGSGGAAGKGFGDIPVGRGVPEAHNDMVFAIIGEQFGFVGSVIVLTAYFVLFAAGLEIAAATREPFGKLVAVGIVAVLAAQTFLNLLVCVRLFPVTGVTLPFVSYGGSSLLASYVAAGLLLNIGQNRPFVMAKDAFEFD